MGFNWLFAVLVLLSGKVLNAAALDLAAHRIERVESQEHKSPAYAQWRNSLSFSNTLIRIPLA
jgi:hypothetical protein